MFTRALIALVTALTLAALTPSPATAQPNCPPDRPTGLSASDGTQCNGVALNWSDVTGATNYEVWRSRNSNMDNDVLIGSPANSQFLDVTALPGITYYYRVRAFRTLCLPGDNFSSFSSINAGRRGTTPPTPGNLDATDGALCTGVRVTWDPIAGSPTYDVLRSTQNDSSTAIPLNPAPLVVENFTDLTALPDRTYYYWVHALTLCGDSLSGSDPGFRGTVPALPVVRTTVTTRCDGVFVSWDAVEAAPPVTGYRILRGSASIFDQAVELQTLPGSATSYLDTSAAIEVAYYYWVISSNNCGVALELPASSLGIRGESLSITQQPAGQTVSPGQIAEFEVAATGTGLTYQWERNQIEIPGATSALLAIVPANPMDAGMYRVIVTGSCGTVASQSAELVVVARPGDCNSPPQPTFTVSLPKLGLPPDEEGQGWDRPAVWEGYPGAGDDSIQVPNGRPIYALLVSGYAQNAYLDELTFYNFARHLMAQGAYVHYAWWNNLLAPYMKRPLHYSQSHPGTTLDLTSFGTPSAAADKAVPGEDYQFVADAKLLLRAIREHNPSAMIIIVGHSMGGGAVVHLASQADVVIDIAAPIDPVGNRNYPWAGPALHQGDSFYNWTRWRATRDNFLGFRSRLLSDACDPSGPWLANINDATATCPAGPYVDDAPTLRFGSQVINLYHRWQNEAIFPFDFLDTYTFDRTQPPGGTTLQSAVTTRAVGPDLGGWPSPNFGGSCCPIGPGVAWPADGHGEIVGFRGPGTTQPLGVRVKTSPNCNGACGDLTWPARTFSGGTWGNGDSCSRRALLQDLESLPLNQTWTHEPYNPDLCLVSSGLISLFNSMNKPPVADAGADQTVTCTGCQSAVVTLDGSGSTDPDHDTLEFTWTSNFGSVSGRIATINLPVGTHCITLEVQDRAGHIARDFVTVTVDDLSAQVVPFTSLAAEWRAAAGAYEARAFDEFFPGVSGATQCLLNSPSTPATISLARGTLTVSARDAGNPVCAITDSSTTPAVSDALIAGAQSVVVFAFDPPLTAFYTYYGSLATGRTATMALYDAAGAHVTSITTPASTHSSLAAGQGFTSTIPIARIEFTSTEPGGVLVGAFVGLRPGEQSLGTVDLGNYNGPNGSGLIELDFACTFVACAADFSGDGTVNSQDFFDFLTAFFSASPRADFNHDGSVNSQDFFDFLIAFFAGC